MLENQRSRIAVDGWLFRLSFAAFVLILLALMPARTFAQAPALSIAGVVWRDDNANGMRDQSEGGMRVPVSLIGPAGEMKTVADENGRYLFKNLDPGPYRVGITNADFMFYLTSPVRLGKGPYEIGVTLSTTPLEKVDFGLHWTLSVPVFRGTAWKDAERVQRPRVAALSAGPTAPVPAA